MISTTLSSVHYLIYYIAKTNISTLSYIAKTNISTLSYALPGKIAGQPVPGSPAPYRGYARGIPESREMITTLR